MTHTRNPATSAARHDTLPRSRTEADPALLPVRQTRGPVLARINGGLDARPDAPQRDAPADAHSTFVMFII